MTVFVADSSTIISCAINCLMWVFEKLNKEGIKFVVPEAVKKEVIDSGMKSKKYKYEAIRVLEYFAKGVFEVYTGDIKKETSEIQNYANTSFYIKNKPMRIIHEADAQVLALAQKINADGILVDEKNMRLLVEHPERLRGHLEKKFHSKTKMIEKNIRLLQKLCGDKEIFRSADLIAYAYKRGAFDEIINTCIVKEKDCKKEILEGLLFALKFAGCTISFSEINDYVNLLR